MIDFEWEFFVIFDVFLVFVCFDCLMQERSYIVLVVDEYGFMVGFVMFEDVMEILIGFQIMDEFDMVEDM